MLRGYDASMTLGHTKNIDILVFDPKKKERYQVEVKTNLEARNGPSKSKLFGRFVTDWQMHEKHEKIDDTDLFYCFVHINSRQGTDYVFRFFIVPSKIVANYVRDEHALWLKDSPAHHDTERRLFRIGLPNETKIEIQTPLAEKYENNWRFAS
jgi:hypothetical protein